MHIDPAVIAALSVASPEIMEQYRNLFLSYTMAREKRLRWSVENRDSGKMIPFYLTLAEYHAYMKLLAFEADLTGQPFLASLNLLSPPANSESTQEPPKKER